jgi:hypothetical protein
MKISLTFTVTAEGEIDEPATELNIARAKDQFLGKLYGVSLIRTFCHIDVTHASQTLESLIEA